MLSELPQTEGDVLRVRGRLDVVGTGHTMDALGAAGAPHCHGTVPSETESRLSATETEPSGVRS